MASLQCKNGSWHVQFKYKGDRRTWVIGRVEEIEARAIKGKVEYLLMRLKQNLLSVPAECDIVEFLRWDGKPPLKDTSKPREDIPLSALWAEYLKTHSNGALEVGTILTRRLHMSHLMRLLGEGAAAESLGMREMQRYIDTRLGEGVTPQTIRLEVSTLKTVYNWGLRMGWVKSPLLIGRFVYPKTDEVLAWLTLEEYEKRVAAGADPCSLADAVYFTAPEVEVFLDHARGRAGNGWEYPACVFVAHTGARRSEMRRLRPEHVDMGAKVVTVHERKRIQGKRTTRTVPMSGRLVEAITPWLEGRKYCFGYGCLEMHPTTAWHGLIRMVAGTRWEAVTGWHTLRHSFISALASQGIDQRTIDALVGHQTEEQRRRYRHLCSATQRQAIDLVFGNKPSF